MNGCTGFADRLRPKGIISVMAYTSDDDLERQFVEADNHSAGSVLLIRHRPNFGWISIEPGCQVPDPGSTYLCCTVNRKVMVTARPLDDWLISKYSLTHWAEIVLPE